jgi:hypothetical protein
MNQEKSEADTTMTTDVAPGVEEKPAEESAPDTKRPPIAAERALKERVDPVEASRRIVENARRVGPPVTISTAPPVVKRTRDTYEAKCLVPGHPKGPYIPQRMFVAGETEEDAKTAFIKYLVGQGIAEEDIHEVKVKHVSRVHKV